jgi:type IV fimbrial biogenesis protein FimT
VAATGQAGFTLVELMITIAVLAILIALATPSFTSVINSNRLAAQANNLTADLQLARSEAVRRNRRVSVCRTTDGAACAARAGDSDTWLVVVPNTVPLEILRSNALKPPVELTSSVTSVEFRSDGLARSGTGGLLSAAFTVCLPTTHPAQNVRTINLDGGSRLSIESDTHSTPGSCP